MWYKNKLQIRKVATSLPCHNNIDIIESFFSVVFLELPSVYIHYAHIQREDSYLLIITLCANPLVVRTHVDIPSLCFSSISAPPALYLYKCIVLTNLCTLPGYVFLLIFHEMNSDFVFVGTLARLVSNADVASPHVTRYFIISALLCDMVVVVVCEDWDGDYKRIECDWV